MGGWRRSVRAGDEQRRLGLNDARTTILVVRAVSSGLRRSRYSAASDVVSSIPG